MSTVFGPFGFTTVKTTPASPTTATAVTLRKTSSWKDESGSAWGSSFYAVIAHPGTPDYGRAEVVLVNTFDSTGITSMTRAQKGTSAIAIRDGDRVYPYPNLAIDSHAIVVDVLTRTAINAAITTANAAGGGDVIIPGGLGAIVLDRSGVSLNATTSKYHLIEPKSNVHLYIGPGTWLEPPADSSACAIIGYVGAYSASHTLGATLARNATQFTMAAGGVAAQGFVDGSYILFVDGPTSGVNAAQIGRVAGTPAGEVVQTVDHISWDFVDAVDYAIRLTSFLDDFSVEGEFRVGSNTGQTYAIYILRAVECDFTRVKTSGFDNNATVGAVFLGATYHVKIAGCEDEGSGSAGQGAWTLDNCWNFNIEDSVLQPAGFGWQFERCGQFTRTRSGAVGATGRGTKYDKSRDGADLFSVGNNCSASGFGFQNCDNIVAFRPQAHGNLYGIFWAGVVGEYSTNITVVEPDAKGNGADYYLGDPMETNRIVGGNGVIVHPLITDGAAAALATRMGGYTLRKNYVAVAIHATNETTGFSFTVPGGLLIQGGLAPMVRATSHFFYSSPTNARTLTLRVKYGGTAMVAKATAAVTVDAATRVGRVEFDLWNDGTQTIVYGRLYISAPDSGAGTGLGNFSGTEFLAHSFQGVVANGTEDPTADQVVDVTFQHSAADVTMSVVRSVAVVL